MSKNVWLVNQGKTYKSELENSILWAPDDASWHHQTMKDLAIGDIVVHYCIPSIRAISIVRGEYRKADKKFDSDQWGTSGLEVPLKYYVLKQPIVSRELKSIMAQLRKLQPDTHAPFNVNGNVNVMYLGKFSIEALNLIRNHFGNNSFPDELSKILDAALPISQHEKQISNFEGLISELLSANAEYSKSTIIRFVSSLLTKPFSILTGLSGSGKTKLAEAFSLWISENPDAQICLAAVGADWTNREPLLGYSNALKEKAYVRPDNGVLDLLLHAKSNPGLPHFLILDEMNMSHVERYFADFLSAIESVDGKISLHPGNEVWGDVPPSIQLPKNLFIIGTVNIDETTYMFSPKVLDRAHVIEFRVSSGEMDAFLQNPLPIDMEQLKGKGAAMGADFVVKAQEERAPEKDLEKSLLPFFDQLQKVGAEFGYRTAKEISRFVSICTELAGGSMNRESIIDAAIMQKLLPKLHGSRNKLEKVLLILGRLCLADEELQKSDSVNPFEKKDGDRIVKDEAPCGVRYVISHEKLMRMYKRVLSDGFTSFAEA